MINSGESMLALAGNMIFMLIAGGSVAGIIIIVTALATVLAYFARKTSIVRETSLPPRADSLPPYSLGRCQMAFWFFQVLASYLLIVLVTREQTPIPSQVLGLMGIAAVIMHKYEELEYTQIAVALSCSPQTVKSLLFRAYNTLRVRLAHMAAA